MSRRAHHPLGKILSAIEVMTRQSQVDLAVEVVELLHMTYGQEPRDAALEVAGIFGMDAKGLLESYNTSFDAHDERTRN